MIVCKVTKSVKLRKARNASHSQVEILLRHDVNDDGDWAILVEVLVGEGSPDHTGQT